MDENVKVQLQYLEGGTAEVLLPLEKVRSAAIIVCKGRYYLYGKLNLDNRTFVFNEVQQPYHI